MCSREFLSVSLLAASPNKSGRRSGISKPSSTGWSSWPGSQASITTTTPKPRTTTVPSRRWQRSRRAVHQPSLPGPHSVVPLRKGTAETAPRLRVSVVKWILYGEASQRRSLDVCGDDDPGFYRTGHDLQRLGCDGEGALRVGLRVFA